MQCIASMLIEHWTWPCMYNTCGNDLNIYLNISLHYKKAIPSKVELLQI